jgi:hypothetical protein
MDPHHFNKQNLEPHQSESWIRIKVKRLIQIRIKGEKVQAFEGHFRALKGPNLGAVGSGYASN